MALLARLWRSRAAWLVVGVAGTSVWFLKFSEWHYNQTRTGTFAEVVAAVLTIGTLLAAVTELREMRRETTASREAADKNTTLVERTIERFEELNRRDDATVEDRTVPMVLRELHPTKPTQVAWAINFAQPGALYDARVRMHFDKPVQRIDVPGQSSTLLVYQLGKVEPRPSLNLIFDILCPEGAPLTLDSAVLEFTDPTNQFRVEVPFPDDQQPPIIRQI